MDATLISMLLLFVANMLATYGLVTEDDSVIGYIGLAGSCLMGLVTLVIYLMEYHIQL